jgi:putative flippase GtrA
MSLAQYSRFLVVGGIVGVLTICCREVIAYILGSDTPVLYSVSVVCAYGIGIATSFFLNSRFTFTASGGFKWAKFARFTAIALLGMLSTWLLSLTLRYTLKLHVVFGDASAGIAFAIATLLSSMITYPLNAAVVFRAPTRRPS